MPTWTIQLIYALNGLWFCAAFVQFSIAQDNTLKILVPREARENPLTPTIKASVSFLGGMNGAISLFCLALAIRPDLLAEPAERALLLAFLSLVNLSQFACNIPVLLSGGRRGVALWPVLSGPMLKIFIIDATLTLVDGFAALAALSGN